MQIMKWVAVCGLIAALSACADSSRSLNPTAPSALVASADQTSDASAVSSATGKGGVPGRPENPGNGNGKPDNPGNGNGKPDDPGNGNGSGRPENPGNDNGGNPHNDQPVVPPVNQTPTISAPVTPPPAHPPVKTKVEIEGVIASIDTAAIGINGQTVQVLDSTTIRDDEDAPVAFGDLQIGDRVHVRAMRVVAQGATTLEAAQIVLQNPVGDDGDDEEEDPVDPTTVLISVVAVDATAKETDAADKGIFLFARSGDTTNELTVTFTLTGTASNGTDYETLPLSVTFAAGSATATLDVVAKADALVEGAELVVLTVVDGEGYAAGAPAVATVGIAG